jgi:hypothetical protein
MNNIFKNIYRRWDIHDNFRKYLGKKACHKIHLLYFRNNIWDQEIVYMIKDRLHILGPSEEFMRKVWNDYKKD